MARPRGMSYTRCTPITRDGALREISPFSPMPRCFLSRTPAFCLLSVRLRIEVPHGCIHSLRMESAKQAAKCRRNVCNAEKACADLHFVRATCCYS